MFEVTKTPKIITFCITSSNSLPVFKTGIDISIPIDCSQEEFVGFLSEKAIYRLASFFAVAFNAREPVVTLKVDEIKKIAKEVDLLVQDELSAEDAAKLVNIWAENCSSR